MDSQPAPGELTFQLIVESAPNAIVLVNKEGKIAYVNQQTEKLFGYQRTEVIGQIVEILIPDRFVANHHGFRNTFFKSPQVRAMGAGRELFAMRKDKTEFPIEIGLTPVATAEGTLVLASIIDISERKSAEEQFRLVVESAPNAMVLVNQEGNIVLVNNQAELLFDYTRDELIGRKIESLIPTRFKHDHPGHRSNFFKEPKTRSMGSGRDLYAMQKNGSEIPVEIGLNPIEMPGGQMVLASIIDITERKIQDLTLKKKFELELRNKELEQFAYIASHDLQEPLRTVSNYMEIFVEDYASKLDDDAKKYIDSVKRATNRMSAQVKALLDFSRLGKGQKLVSVDFRRVVDLVIEDLHAVIKKSNAKIKIGDLPVVAAYETEVGILFQNLISNAIKFRREEASPEIAIQSEMMESGWKFSIRDNGIGIAPTHFKRIFDIFQRLHTTAKYEGNGIGLSVCRRIVELHGGEIWVDAELGQGSTFNFTIPKLSI
jgi:PAS domain S-box-containing protein